MRARRRVFVWAGEEDAAIVRCVMNLQPWCRIVLSCAAVGVVVVGHPSAEEQIAEDVRTGVRAATRARVSKVDQMAMIVLARGAQLEAARAAAMERYEKTAAVSRVMVMEWDKDWAELIEWTRLMSAQKRGPRKGFKRAAKRGAIGEQLPVKAMVA